MGDPARGSRCAARKITPSGAGAAVVIDLLRSDLFLRLSADPSLLESLIDGRGGRSPAHVVIDEIQKIAHLRRGAVCHRADTSKQWAADHG